MHVSRDEVEENPTRYMGVRGKIMEIMVSVIP